MKREIDDHIVLQNYTDEQLEKELELRNYPPDAKASEDVNISNLRTQAEEYIENVHKQGCPPKDAEHFIFEAVMTTFYGNDIWSWINKHNIGP